jgi:hypothetical protein
MDGMTARIALFVIVEVTRLTRTKIDAGSG